MCKDCRKQFVKNPVIRKIPDEKKELVDKLLPEKIPLAGICRVTGVSGQWLQSYVNEKYEDIKTKTTPLVKKNSSDS